VLGEDEENLCLQFKEAMNTRSSSITRSYLLIELVEDCQELHDSFSSTDLVREQQKVEEKFHFPRPIPSFAKKRRMRYRQRVESLPSPDSEEHQQRDGAAGKENIDPLRSGARQTLGRNDQRHWKKSEKL
jgi:hypothetical protein